jgi:hypothetical protein
MVHGTQHSLKETTILLHCGRYGLQFALRSFEEKKMTHTERGDRLNWFIQISGITFRNKTTIEIYS